MYSFSHYLQALGAVQKAVAPLLSKASGATNQVTCKFCHRCLQQCLSLSCSLYPYLSLRITARVNVLSFFFSLLIPLQKTNLYVSPLFLSVFDFDCAAFYRSPAVQGNIKTIVSELGPPMKFDAKALNAGFKVRKCDGIINQLLSFPFLSFFRIRNSLSLEIYIYISLGKQLAILS